MLFWQSPTPAWPHAWGRPVPSYDANGLARTVIIHCIWVIWVIYGVLLIWLYIWWWWWWWWCVCVCVYFCMYVLVCVLVCVCVLHSHAPLKLGDIPRTDLGSVLLPPTKTCHRMCTPMHMLGWSAFVCVCRFAIGQANPEQLWVLAHLFYASPEHICRVGQNRIYTPNVTVYLVISLPKIPYVNRIYMVLANPDRKSVV